jgi:4-hydroxy-2-oxoheptanedioate aldolase
VSGPSPERTLRARVLAGETLFGLFLDLGSPFSAEICARAGYDWLVVDLEHGAGTEAGLVGLLQSVEVGGSTAVVRPQSGERLRIGRALDLGAAGIVIPRLESAAEAREAVSYLRYPPAGVRGVALRTRGAGMGSVAHGEVHQIDERILGIVQIESVGALREADQIAAIDGVDVLSSDRPT